MSEFPSDPVDDERTDALIAACLAEVEESGPNAIEEFCREHPDLALLVRRRFELLQKTGLLDDSDAEPAMPSRFGPYRVVGRLGGGGMGVVYRAVQEDLERDVAIKTIRPELLHFRDARARFRREVETLARLSHPGIVPVFGSGEEQGAPWFAMQHVAGASLAQLLNRLRGRDPAELTGRDLRAALVDELGEDEGGVVDQSSDLLRGSSWIEICISLGRDVAAALDHAHCAGVLHRDVKPSNLLLGRDGRVRLFDFGLARQDGEDLQVTRTGAMVGSLPYMAPEQVRGVEVDRRTDVYGLAATLVELATLRPPFDVSDPERLRASILDGQLPRLTARNRAMPRDLATVLAKAMERDPEQRYASATEFSADLQAVVESRPILARPAGPVLQLRRWARRRPAHAVALAATVAFLVALPIVLGVANARISRALERAEARFGDAQEAIVGLAATVADQELRDVPGMGAIREDVLARSLAMYDRLVPDKPDDVDVLFQRALLQRQLASLRFELGRVEDAKRLGDAAEAWMRERLERAPGDGVVLAALVDLLVDRSSLGGEGALELLDEVLLLLDRAPVDERVDAGDLLVMRRQALHNRANLLRRAGRAEDAFAAAERACDVADDLLGISPDGDARARLASGESRGLRAMLHHDADRDADALRDFERAEQVLSDLVADVPRPIHRFRLGIVQTNLAHLEYGVGRGEQAERHALRSVEVFARLCREQPWRTAWRKRLAMAYDIVGGALLLQDRSGDAVGWLERGVHEMTELVAMLPGDRSVALRCAINRHNCASAFVELERRAEARPHSDAAVQAMTELAAAGDRGAKNLLPMFRLLQVRTGIGNGSRVPSVDYLYGIVRSAGEPNGDLWFQFAVSCADIAGVEGAAGFGDSAVRGLQKAVEAGFDDGQRVDGAKALGSVRHRVDFGVLRARMR